MSNFNFINAYRNDPSVGHLETPITGSMITRVLLGNLPIYRSTVGFMAGLEIGLAHGYFILGPFYKTGPLRNSTSGLLASFMATIGLIIILTVALKIYGIAQFEKSGRFGLMPYASESEKQKFAYSWESFTGGFIVGGSGGASFAYIILSALK
jgi:hypothetical protein